jgi:hypothetical protein
MMGENEDVQVFYYFIELEKNSKEDPLMLLANWWTWLLYFVWPFL